MLLCYHPNYLTRAHEPVGPSLASPPHIATWHHLGVCLDSRGLAMCPRHLRAWVRVALPCGLACHVASAQVPRPTSASRVLWRNKTPFFAFFRGIINQNKFYKIQKNPKNSEINNFKNITPFKLKFSPLDHKFLHL